ncbi:MAG: transmembrane Mn(2+) transporter, partial [Pirellulales bacterium]|nr:transmembrane Mn(2+) transporter [Pirellulales bacterium]
MPDPSTAPSSAIPSTADSATDTANQTDAAPVDPPIHPLRIIRCIGPGLIVAGSIVGSGELIATTKTGAEAGFSLLWLIILGCLVKVFAQIEFGRYAIISGKPTLRALDEVPGPRIKGRGNWLVWYWVVMWLASISQLGGIVGGVGQALAISAPLTQAGTEYNEVADAETLSKFEDFLAKKNVQSDQAAPPAPTQQAPAAETEPSQPTVPKDAAIWATI